MAPVLLTDDEIVALMARCDVAWPLPLPTVGRVPDLVRAAGVRGVRSLAVRGLADTRAPAAVSYQDDLLHMTRSIARAEARVLAYVARRTEVFAPRGAIVGVFRSGDDRWLIDSMTGNGVHAIWPGAGVDAVEIIARFGRAVWESGVSDPTGAGDMGLLVASSDAAKPVFFVGRGHVSRLSIVLGEPSMVFTVEDRDEPLSETDIAGLLP